MGHQSADLRGFQSRGHVGRLVVSAGGRSLLLVHTKWPGPDSSDANQRTRLRVRTHSGRPTCFDGRYPRAPPAHCVKARTPIQCDGSRDHVAPRHPRDLRSYTAAPACTVPEHRTVTAYQPFCDRAACRLAPPVRDHRRGRNVPASDCQYSLWLRGLDRHDIRCMDRTHEVPSTRSWHTRVRFRRVHSQCNRACPRCLCEDRDRTQQCRVRRGWPRICGTRMGICRRDALAIPKHRVCKWDLDRRHKRSHDVGDS